MRGVCADDLTDCVVQCVGSLAGLLCLLGGLILPRFCKPCPQNRCDGLLLLVALSLAAEAGAELLVPMPAAAALLSPLLTLTAALARLALSSPPPAVPEVVMWTLCVAARAWRCSRVFRPLPAAAGLLCAIVVVHQAHCLLNKKKALSKHNAIKSGISTNTAYKHSQARFLSKLTYFWLTHLLKVGYLHPLEIENLGYLPEDEKTESQFWKFFVIYLEEQKTNGNGKKPFLWKCYFKFCWRNFLLGGILKLAGDVVGYVGPLGISVIIDYVTLKPKQDPSNSTENQFGENNYPAISEFISNGYIMCIVVFVATLAQGSFSQWSTHLVNMEGIHLKQALQGFIYVKSLRLCTWVLNDSKEGSKTPKKHSLNEDSIDQNGYEETASKNNGLTDVGMITNLLTEDTFNIMSFFWIGHYIWAIPLKIGILMYLLYLKLGISAVVGACTCIIIVTPLQFIIGKKMSTNSKFTAEMTDERLKKVNEVLQGIKLLKLYGWECLYGSFIKETRNKELSLLNKDSFYWLIITFLTHASTIVVTAITFAVYFALEDQPPTVANVFTGLALFNQLTVPLFIFPITVPVIINALVSTRRLQNYLNLPETSDILPRTTDDGYFKGKNSAGESIDNEVPHIAVKKINKLESIFKRKNSVKEKENIESVKDEIIVSFPEVIYDSSDTSVLKEYTGKQISIPKGKLTMIVGPVGSGKTMLLSVLLGEVKSDHGDVIWMNGSSIAYSSQKPWLLNATLRDNILFGLEYQPHRYNEVIAACALQPDIDILPAKDLTEIGEKGINLSGGQKYRISIARALYSEANVVILDDPLSALDYHVALQVFQSGLKDLLLKHQRTVIMTTNSLQLLPQAYNIIALESGKVRVYGSLKHIEKVDSSLVNEWKDIMMQEKRNSASRGHTARERWRLIQTISRIGVQLKHLTTWRTNDCIFSLQGILPFVPFKKRKPTIRKTNSRHFIHDLPLPIDECEDELIEPLERIRHGRSFTLGLSSKHKNVLRMSSLQTYRSSEAAPDNLLRQFSSPNMPCPNTPSRQQKVDYNQCLDETVPLECVRLNKDIINEEDCSIEKYTINNSKVISDEEREYGKISKKLYLEYMRACGVFVGISFLVLTVIWHALKVFTDYWISKWTGGTENSEATDPNKTVFYFKVYLILSVATILLSLVSNGIGQYAGSKARRTLHEGMLNNMVFCPVRFFESTPVGRILNRFSADISVIDKKIAISIQRLLQFLLLCTSAIFVNAIVCPWLLLAAIPICVVYYIVQKFYRFSARELQRLDGITRSPVLSHFSETLGGLSTIRAFNHQKRFTDAMFQKMDVHNNAFIIMNTGNRWLGIALDYLGAFIVLIAILAALISSSLYPKNVSPALIGLAVNYTLLVPVYLNWVVKFLADTEMYMSAVERVHQYAFLPTEEYHPKDNAVDIPPQWPEKGNIRFDRVTLRYSLTREPVIVNLNLHIPAGQKLGVCGRTGSGKSSLAMALFRMVDVTDGCIYIDDVDIKQVPLKTLRSRLSIIPQEVIMFSGTIRKNLDPENQYTDEELWQCLELVQLKDVVNSFAGQLEAQVREGGENLSSGERQLFCLARAVLHRPVCLIMDEATSSIDPKTERALLEAAKTAFQGCTIISIAHRLRSLLDYDRIIVLDSGQIIEDGSPKELLKHSMGVFSSMLRSYEEGSIF